MSEILSDAELADLQEQRAIFADQVNSYQLMVAEIDAQLAAHRQAVAEQATELRKGDLLMMTQEAQTLIGTKNNDLNSPYGTLRLWPVGKPVRFGHAYLSSEGWMIFIHDIGEQACSAVGGIPLDMAQDMRRAYLAQEEA